jgi:hypothetical protein
MNPELYLETVRGWNTTTSRILNNGKTNSHAPLLQRRQDLASDSGNPAVSRKKNTTVVTFARQSAS